MKGLLLLLLIAEAAFSGRGAAPAWKGTTNELVQAELERAERAFHRRDLSQAIASATSAMQVDTRNVKAYLIRGQAYEESYQHEKAVADFDAALRLEPKAALVYQHRGCERFKLGQIDLAIADFDHYLDLLPAERPYHWQRGIALYYADRYEDGRKQFELHQTVNSNDVENAVWHYLCAARTAGVEKARSSLLAISADGRIPMMQIYDLFRGTGSAQEVLDAANAGNPTPSELKNRLFYSHFYLGLYYDAAGQPKLAEEHMSKAAGPYAQLHYMGDVARIHMKRLQRNTGGNR